MPLTTAELTDLLARLRLQPEASSPADLPRAELDLLLARVAALTDALRGGERTAVTAMAERLLLADLGLVAARLRGDATGLREALARVIEPSDAGSDPAA